MANDADAAGQLTTAVRTTSLMPDEHAPPTATDSEPTDASDVDVLDRRYRPGARRRVRQDDERRCADGAKQKQIPAVANDPAPTNTTSCARVTLDRRSGRWLVSQFEPI